MSVNVTITKDKLDEYLRELGKAYSKMGGKGVGAEIVLIGGAAVLASYKFREMTTDADAIIRASSVMKDASKFVADKYEKDRLPHDWLNTDFKNTESYSDKLVEVSTHYKTFSHVLDVRMVSDEYLVAMKLLSGREYKYDLSDIVGIMKEHEEMGLPISQNDIKSAFNKLYPVKEMPDISKTLLQRIEVARENGTYDELYNQVRSEEVRAKELLVEFDEKYPSALKEASVADVVARLVKKDNK